jgi:hypothetical protein
MSLALMMLLAASASVPDDEVKVHEWGVVLYLDGSTTAQGSAGGPWWGPSDMQAEAPVVCFRGPEFSGSFRVSSTGRIVNAWPEPDEALELGLARAGGSSVLWEGLTARALEPGDQPWSSGCGEEISVFGWAAPSWRLSESLVLERTADSTWCDSFLYYEVDLSGTAFPLPLPGLAPAGADQSELVSGQILVFSRDENGQVTLEISQATERSPAEESLSDQQGYASEWVLDVLMSWGGSALAANEIQAMWGTWEPYILYGDWEGRSLVVFPMPQSLVERISSLELRTDNLFGVNYERFFIGMVEMP